MNHSNDLTAHYAEYYQGTSRWRELSAADKAANIRRNWARIGGPSKTTCPTVVDIGCGEGAIAASLQHFYHAYYGYELSSSAVKAAISRNLPSANFALFDGISLPVASQSVDLVVLSHVVEHLEHPRVLLAEARRLGRHVFVEVPLEYRWRTPHDFRWTDVGHINLYTPLLIRQLMQSVGLEIVHEQLTNPRRELFTSTKSRTRGSIQWLVREFGMRACPPLASRLFTYHYCLLARSTPPPKLATEGRQERACTSDWEAGASD